MPEQLRQHVRLTMPGSLEGALQEAVRTEAVLSTQAAPRLAPVSLPYVRASEGPATPIVDPSFEPRTVYWSCRPHLGTVFGLLG